MLLVVESKMWLRTSLLYSLGKFLQMVLVTVLDLLFIAHTGIYINNSFNVLRGFGDVIKNCVCVFLTLSILSDELSKTS